MATATRTPPQTAPLPHFSASSPSARRNPLPRRLAFHPLSPKVSVVMSIGGGGENSNLSYTSDRPKPACSSGEQVPVGKEEEGEEEERVEVEGDGGSEALKAYGSAKIHDFCFGIPYGGFIISGGLLGFVFSRNPAALANGVLFGGALLVLSTFSLKVWRRGGSSLPFVLGQAVLSGALFWKNFQAYFLTKKLIPTGFYALISAAMFCFYSYVMLSGGNPPPKKLKASTSYSS